jgi:hypothetical protein
VHARPVDLRQRRHQKSAHPPIAMLGHSSLINAAAKARLAAS